MTVLSLELLIAGGARMVRAEPEAKGVAPAIIVGMPDSYNGFSRSWEGEAGTLQGWP